MFSVGMKDALATWSELEQAWHDTNKFGGDTAEIYAYRLSPLTPTTLLGEQNALGRAALEEHGRQAASNLAELLAYFAERRKCFLEVDGRLFDPEEGVRPFTSRVAVKVLRTDPRQRR